MRSTRKDACLFTLIIGEQVQEAVPCGLVRIMKIKDDDKTSGTEPSAAASKINGTGLLGIKPIALFEKMRKYGIKGQRFKLSEKLKNLPPHE